MGRKTNTKKISLKNLKLKNILFFISILLVISFICIVGKNTGVFGKKIKEFYFNIFGVGSFIIVPAILSHLLLVVFNKINKKIHISFALLYLLFILGLTILDLNTNIGDTLVIRKENSLILANHFQGAGLLGSSICHFLLTSIGKVGIYISTIIALFFSGVYILDVEMKSLRDDIVTFFKKLGEIIDIFINKVKELLDKTSNKDKIPSREQNVKVSNTIKSEPIIDKTHKKDVDREFITFNTYDDSDTKEKDSKTDEIEKVEDFSEQLEIEKNILSKTKVNSVYKFPPIQLLKDPIKTSGDSKQILLEKASKIEETLSSFGIECRVVSINKGPTVTSFELEPPLGVKVSKIVNLSDDLALALASPDIRIEAPIPGKSLVGIEVPNSNKEMVFFKEIIDSEEFTNLSSPLPLGLGKDIQGNTIVSSIEKMPHLLIAGATGSGKSVCINSIILSILFKSNPDDVKMILVDPKVVELGIYNDIPHLAIPVVTNPKKASFALNWAISEMERRYKIFSNNYVKDIKAYNVKSAEEDLEKLPYIVIIIDELSDLMMVAAGEVEDAITRLAQMARACGIHLIIATQRPSVDVITGTIKANIPSRISFAVSSQIDSRTILDMSGAEKLLGRGDMLFLPSGQSKPIRIQGAFISDKEVENIVSYLKNKNESDYDRDIIENIEKTTEQANKQSGTDELFNEAVKIVIEEDSASISMLQRRMKIGYARAGRIIDEMAEMGIISGYEGSKPRRVLVDKNYLEELDV
ncbi:DNA translocase FtsK [Lagierella sp. ICN-221743]